MLQKHPNVEQPNVESQMSNFTTLGHRKIELTTPNLTMFDIPQCLTFRRSTLKNSTLGRLTLGRLTFGRLTFGHSTFNHRSSFSSEATYGHK
jgi:hypothetical protein